MHKFNVGNGSLWLGDCLDLMSAIPDGSVDMVLCDLPYGTTACAWDTVIPFEPLWKHYWRVAKPNAAIVLMASQPFTTALIGSQIARFKYEWIWDKSLGTGHVHAKNKPLKQHENVCVFSQGTTVHVSQSATRMPYFPQDIIETRPKIRKNAAPSQAVMGSRPSHRDTTIRTSTNYPTSIIEFSNAARNNIQHPTQKPVALFEYLIKTYTNEGAMVLDNCSGSGTTAIAAQQCGRRWLCIEKEPQYFYASAGRIHAAVNA